MPRNANPVALVLIGVSALVIFLYLQVMSNITEHYDEMEEVGIDVAPARLPITLDLLTLETLHKGAIPKNKREKDLWGQHAVLFCLAFFVFARGYVILFAAKSDGKNNNNSVSSPTRGLKERDQEATRVDRDDPSNVSAFSLAKAKADAVRDRESFKSERKEVMC